MSKAKLIPELRFPEFMGKDTWKSTKLSHILFEHGLKSDGTEEVFSVSVHKGVVNQIEHLGRRFAASNTENYKRVFPGDIIYTKSPTGDFPLGIIKQSKVSIPVIVSPLYGVFAPKTNSLGLILDAYFEYPERTINYLNSIVQKGAKNTINIRNDIFLSKSLVLPVDTLEQQKIAACLSSLDALIAAHTHKLGLLKGHKKGLLQNLFPQPSTGSGGGKNVPNLRFREFEQDGEWIEYTLGNIATFSKGKGISKSDVVENGATPCIRYGELYTSYGETIENVFSSTNVDTRELILSEANDVIIPASGETQIDIATASCVMKSGIALGGDLNIIKSEMDGVFLAYYLNSAKKKDIAQVAQGISVVHLYSNQLKTLTICVPKMAEQQKIASTLSAVDVLITAEAKKIEVLQQHKKGLLQGLFPKIEEEA